MSNHFSGKERIGEDEDRMPTARGLLLSDDGDHILKGNAGNFFIVCRKVLFDLSFLILNITMQWLFY